MKKSEESGKGDMQGRIGTLALIFLKIGLFTFGGGYAMIALLEREFVRGRKWMGDGEFLDMISISESTPGPVAINMATYIGYKMAGIWGAAVSTVAVCIPSFLIIYGISLFFEAFVKLSYVQYAFRGVQVCVIYLIFSAGVRMFKVLEKNLFQKCILCLVSATMLLCTLFSESFSSILCILLCGVAGIVDHAILQVRRRGEEK